MTTPPSDDNPFRTPDYTTPSYPSPDYTAPTGTMPVPPPTPGIPHWFTTKVRITLVACVVLALGLGSLGALVIFWAHRAGPPSEGDCLYLSREGSDQLAYHRVGCAETGATFKVDRRTTGTSTCGTGDYVRFRITDSGVARTLCLALNANTGECLRDVDDEAAIAKLSCTDPAAQIRVRVVSGYGGAALCQDTEKILTYAGPPRRTLCLTPTGENI